MAKVTEEQELTFKLVWIMEETASPVYWLKILNAPKNMSCSVAVIVQKQSKEGWTGSFHAKRFWSEKTMEQFIDKQFEGDNLDLIKAEMVNFFINGDT